jgi:hypothetical protein
VPARAEGRSDFTLRSHRVDANRNQKIFKLLVVRILGLFDTLFVCTHNSRENVPLPQLKVILLKETPSRDFRSSVLSSVFFSFFLFTLGPDSQPETVSNSVLIPPRIFNDNRFMKPRTSFQKVHFLDIFNTKQNLK